MNKTAKRRLAAAAAVAALAAAAVSARACRAEGEAAWMRPPPALAGIWLSGGLPAIVINPDGSGSFGGEPAEWSAAGFYVKLFMDGHETVASRSLAAGRLSFGAQGRGPMAGELAALGELSRLPDAWGAVPGELEGAWLLGGEALLEIGGDGSGSAAGSAVELWLARGPQLRIASAGAETTVFWRLGEDGLELLAPASGPLAAALAGAGPLERGFLGDVPFSAIAGSGGGGDWIDLSFAVPIGALPPGSVSVESAGGAAGGKAEAVALSGGGAGWRVHVALLREGDVDVRVSAAGIDPEPRRARLALGDLRGASQGDDHAVAVRRDGTLWAWGANPHGQLGDGSSEPQPSPARIGALGGWASASAGEAHTVAVREDGSLWAWGHGGWGQLGLGALPGSREPARVGSGYGWASASAGRWHTVAVARDGSLWAWGRNREGQLGDGTTTDRRLPARVGDSLGWVAASAGGSHTVALREDGTLWAWGANWTGQLGTGELAGGQSPARVGAERRWAAASAGRWHTVAVAEDGSLWAWGGNGFGRLGDGTTENRSSPVRIGSGSGWAAASAGGSHTAAVMADGTLWAWGRGAEGQIGAAAGPGAAAAALAPAPAAAGSGWALASAGRDRTAALGADGSLWLGGAAPGMAGAAAEEP